MANTDSPIDRPVTQRPSPVTIHPPPSEYTDLIPSESPALSPIDEIPSIQSDPPGLCFDVDVQAMHLFRRIGGGGFGTVYVVPHATAGKAAVKRLVCVGDHEEMANLFRVRMCFFTEDDTILRSSQRTSREAKIWAAARHPNVLAFWGIIQGLDGIYLVSPYVKNGSLTGYIKKHPDADRPRFVGAATFPQYVLSVNQRFFLRKAP